MAQELQQQENNIGNMSASSSSIPKEENNAVNSSPAAASQVSRPPKRRQASLISSTASLEDSNKKRKMDDGSSSNADQSTTTAHSSSIQADRHDSNRAHDSDRDNLNRSGNNIRCRQCKFQYVQQERIKPLILAHLRSYMIEHTKDLAVVGLLPPMTLRFLFIYNSSPGHLSFLVRIFKAFWAQ